MKFRKYIGEEEKKSIMIEENLNEQRQRIEQSCQYISMLYSVPLWMPFLSDACNISQMSNMSWFEF